MRWLIGSTIADVLRKAGLTYAVVLGAVERHVAGAVNGDALPSLGVIGLDEIALRKGHAHFIVLVTQRRGDGGVAGRLAGSPDSNGRRMFAQSSAALAHDDDGCLHR